MTQPDTQKLAGQAHNPIFKSHTMPWCTLTLPTPTEDTLVPLLVTPRKKGAIVIRAFPEELTMPKYGFETDGVAG
jgi:hypothetical protein